LLQVVALCVFMCVVAGLYVSYIENSNKFWRFERVCLLTWNVEVCFYFSANFITHTEALIVFSILIIDCIYLRFIYNHKQIDRNL
jgi:uncharacterized membrane protein